MEVLLEVMTERVPSHGPKSEKEREEQVYREKLEECRRVVCQLQEKQEQLQEQQKKISSQFNQLEQEYDRKRQELDANEEYLRRKKQLL